MQEAKDPMSAETAGGNKETESKDPKADATSSDTLSDLEEKEKVPNASGGSERSTESEGGRAPSPDGALGDTGSRGPREDPGPM